MRTNRAIVRVPLRQAGENCESKRTEHSGYMILGLREFRCCRAPRPLRAPVVDRAGFEPAYGKPGQIYSLLPLTTRPPVQGARRAQWRAAAMLSTSAAGLMNPCRTSLCTRTGLATTSDGERHTKDMQPVSRRSPRRRAPALPKEMPTSAPSPQVQSGEVVLTLQPDQGEEVKGTMQAGGEFSYQWSTGGARVNFELHGEEPGAASSEYTT